MKDIVERMRWDNGIEQASADELEAAEEIERLRARLAEAERLLRAMYDNPSPSTYGEARRFLGASDSAVAVDRTTCPHGYRLSELADGTDTCAGCAPETVNEVARG